MVCNFCGILRAVSSLPKRFFSLFFASVVTRELLGNICSEEQGCRQSVQSAGVQIFHWLERLKLRGCCGRFCHNPPMHDLVFFFFLSACYVLLKGMYYRRSYFVVPDALLGYMFYRRAYLTE